MKKINIKKVYCGNCKWHNKGFWGYRCMYHAEGYVTAEQAGDNLSKDLKQNQNNNCKYYRRKHWWKFLARIK